MIAKKPLTPYARKLLDPRWLEFREEAINHHGKGCKNCGQDRRRDESIHVHHKRYYRGREPWEYDMEDVEVICWECHRDIHVCERKWRAMILQMPCWMIVEFNSMADAVEGMSDSTKQQWASYCKNQARMLKGYRRTQEEGHEYED